MKDTLETNLPEEAGKLEETKKPVETPEIDATANVKPTIQRRRTLLLPQVN